MPNPLEYGVIIVDEQGEVKQFLEKPSWGEVFSDTVNTGIYVLDPEIFKYIPRGKITDWSKDVFPQLLKSNDALLGYIAEGYWTDVGTIEEYMRANRDYMLGQVNLPRVGHNEGNDLWVEGDAEIGPDAQFDGPVFLGHGVKIKGGVIIHGPSAIRDYTVVDTRATIDRSIIWRNSYIGERAELRGAIVLRQCNIKSRAVLFEGVVVGDQTIINAGAVIGANVKIWPSKEVDEGATISSSIIWGSQGRRVLFGRNGITGLVNIDLTPEFCAKLSAAFGATLPRGSTCDDEPRRALHLADAQARHDRRPALGRRQCHRSAQRADPGRALHHPCDRRGRRHPPAPLAVRQPRGRYQVLRSERAGYRHRHRAQDRGRVLPRGLPAGLPRRDRPDQRCREYREDLHRRLLQGAAARGAARHRARFQPGDRLRQRECRRASCRTFCAGWRSMWSS